MGKKKKNPAAVKLGRLGGAARARNLTKEELSAIGRRGANALWRKYKGMEDVLSDGDALAEWLHEKADPKLFDQLITAVRKLEPQKGKEQK